VQAFILALHGKLLTADMLAIRGWEHNPTCPLCLAAPETATHLCKDCPFTKAIWSRLQSWDAEDPGPQPHSFPTISDWWDEIIQGKDKKEQRRINGRLLYAIWNAWKERNRRIFTAKRLTYVEVALIAREDILQRERAFTTYVPATPAEPD
jgi:hypothetical protein